MKTEPRATPTVASAAGAHVVLRATQRMTRVRMASEAPKRTTRMAAFALAARLVPGGVAAPAPTTASRPLAARTVRMTRYEADDAAAAFAGTRRFTLSRAAMVAVIGAVLMVLIVVGMGVAVARRAAQHGENAQAPAGRDGR